MMIKRPLGSAVLACMGFLSVAHTSETSPKASAAKAGFNESRKPPGIVGYRDCFRESTSCVIIGY